MSLEPGRGRRAWGTNERSDRLRALNSPQPAAVEVRVDGAPTAMKAVGRSGGQAVGDYKAVGRSGGQAVGDVSIEDVLETWRVDDEWWRQVIARRYYDVVLEGGGRVVLFEDLVTGDWFVQQP